MNKTRNNSLRAWLTALCAAAFCLLGTQTAWGQATKQGVKVGSADVKKVNDVDVNNGDIKEATSGSPVKVTVTDKTGGTTPQVAKVTVVRYDQVKVTDITVTSAGNVTEMNGNAQLQMSATIVPTYADNKTVTWSVASADGSSATATIDASGMLKAGTVQGDVVVTARATNGTEDVTDDVVNTKTITITTIPLTYNAPTIVSSTLTYNGSGQALVTGGSATGGTIYYRYDYTPYIGSASSSEWGTTVPAPTNAGTYTVYYKVEPNAGYSGGVESTQLGSKVISKDNGRVSLSPSSGDDFESFGHADYYVSVNSHGGSLSYTKSGANSSFVSVEVRSGNQVRIYKYSLSTDGRDTTVTITSAATNNYNAASAYFSCKK